MRPAWGRQSGDQPTGRSTFGDLLIAQVTANGTATASPSGWTLIDEVTSDDNCAAPVLPDGIGQRTGLLPFVFLLRPWRRWHWWWRCGASRSFRRSLLPTARLAWVVQRTNGGRGGRCPRMVLYWSLAAPTAGAVSPSAPMLAAAAANTQAGQNGVGVAASYQLGLPVGLSGTRSAGASNAAWTAQMIALPCARRLKLFCRR